MTAPLNSNRSFNDLSEGMVHLQETIRFTPETVCNLLNNYLNQGLSRDAILDKILEEHPYLLDFLLESPYEDFEKKIISRTKRYSAILGYPIADTLKWLYLFARCQSKNFDLDTSFFLLYQHVADKSFDFEENSIEEVADQIADNNPELLDFLQLHSMELLNTEAKRFLSEVANAPETEANFCLLLSRIYLSALQNSYSQAYQSALQLEENDTDGIEQYVARSSIAYWEKLLPMNFCNMSDKRASSVSWKKISSYLSACINDPIGQDRESLQKDLTLCKRLLSELAALCRDLDDFSPKINSKSLFLEQFIFLLKNAYQPNRVTPVFKRCKALFPQLQEQLLICGNQLPALKLHKAFLDRIKDSEKLLHSLVPLEEPTKISQFFNIFDVPIYRAAVILFFNALSNSNQNGRPEALSEACRQALKKFPVDLMHPEELVFKEYEQFTYEVWSEYASKDPDLENMDLPDLLKRCIQALSLKDFELLCEVMYREPLQENRHLVLLAFFSDKAGKLPNLNRILKTL